MDMQTSVNVDKSLEQQTNLKSDSTLFTWMSEPCNYEPGRIFSESVRLRSFGPFVNRYRCLKVTLISHWKGEVRPKTVSVLHSALVDTQSTSIENTRNEALRTH
jgi:hypothetical protein